MMSFALFCGRSIAYSFCSLSPEMVKEYAKDSGKYALSSLLSFPPNLFPLIVLISAIFTTISTVGQFLQGNILDVKQWVLVVGVWSGHHAMMKVQMKEELKKTVNLLSQQLDRTEQQLHQWDKVTRQEEGKLEGMQDITKEIGGITKEFKEISETFSNIIGIQRKISQEYAALAFKMEEGSEQVLVCLREHQEKMKEIEVGLDKRLQLIQEHQRVQLRNIELLQELINKAKNYSSLFDAKQGGGRKCLK